jgi:tRNA(Ile)-lysidine synthase
MNHDSEGCPVQAAIEGLAVRLGAGLVVPPGTAPPPGSARSRSAEAADPPIWVIAFSGGLDSTVLLDACVRWLGAGRLIAAHVHHGLQPPAEAWGEHCEREARSRGVRFACLRLGVAQPGGEGLESWARKERYRALWALAARENAAGLLTAHHADDLAETLLMRLARGTGLEGLAGALPETSQGPEGLALLRPLIRLRRADLEAYARRYALHWISDPMNRDSAYRRVEFRERVLPVLTEVEPGAVQQLARAQALLAQAFAELEAVTRVDFARAWIPGPADEVQAIDRGWVRDLSPFRQAQLYRFWWRQLEGGAGGQMPSEAQCADWRSQMIESRAPQAIVRRGPWLFVRFRDRIEAWVLGRERLVASCLGGTDATGPQPFEFDWRGDSEMVLPGWEARLRFKLLGESGHGRITEGRFLVSAPWRLSAGASSVRVRLSSASGETLLRLRPDGPSRSLRKHSQARGVAAALRPWLPLVEVDARPVLASGVGAVYPKAQSFSPDASRAQGGRESPGDAVGGPQEDAAQEVVAAEPQSGRGSWMVLSFEPMNRGDPRLRLCRRDGL